LRQLTPRLFINHLFLDPLAAIDAQYRTESLPSFKPAAILVTAALALVVPHFFGRPHHFERIGWLVEWTRGLPYPDLHEHLYWAGFKFINYGLIPAVCIKLVLREKIRDHGLKFVREPKIWLLYLGMVLLVLPLTYFASTTEAFLRTYPKYPASDDSLLAIAIWEVAYGFQFFMLEYFFRGFLLFALARYIGWLAIFVMIVPYAMIHFGKPFAECLGSILAGIALGTVSLRTGSIYGGVAVHCAVAWSMDLFAMVATGKLARLLG
jgi:hypothetical protein